jgi:MFS family permease
MAALSPRLPRRLPFALCFLVCGAPRFVVLAFSSSLPPILAVAFVAGLGAGGINPALDAAQYERIPPDYHARVLGAMSAIGWAGVPFGGLAGGLLADTLGLGASFLVLGALYLAATLLPFILPVWKQMERPALRCPDLSS